MNPCSNHSNHQHCCHKVQAWVQEQYIDKRIRSPYKERSFLKTLRTYAAPPGFEQLMKSKSLSKLSLKGSRLTVMDQLKQNNQNNQNRRTEGTPTDSLGVIDKSQTPIRDNIIFKQIQQSNSADILPFDLSLPFASDFQRVTLESHRPNELSPAQKNECDNNGQIIKQIPEAIQASPSPMQLLEQLMNSSLEERSKKRQTGRKFSLRIMKRQFKDLWSRDRIQELSEAIIQTRDLCSLGEHHEIKAKLYALLLNQLP